MNTVVCPHCKKTLEISEAIIHQLQEQVRKEENDKLRAEFAKENAEKEALREKKLREQFENENKERVKQLELAKKNEKELSEKLLLSELEAKKREAKIKELAEAEVTKKFQLNLLEEKKKNTDMQKALEEAQRKAKQSSQQLQGEVLELDMEVKLKEMFPTDQFAPIPKGFQGGDIMQKIIYKGNVVGSILWETKNTKNWSKAWLVKLKEDAGRINATESIIVSQVLPDGVKIFDRREGVWVTTYEHAISTCRFIRFLITTVSSMKLSASQTDEEWGKVRDYMLSDSFKHRMQTHFDGIKALRESLNAEKRAAIIRWKKQEAQIEKLDNNTTNFYGELRAIVPDIPKVEGVDTLLLEDNYETETLL